MYYGKKEFGVDWLSFTVFTNKKREGMDTFVCAVSLHVVEIPKASIKAREPPLPIAPFGIVAYGFVGQPFSKQLYSRNILKIGHFQYIKIQLDSDVWRTQTEEMNKHVH